MCTRIRKSNSIHEICEFSIIELGIHLLNLSEFYDALYASKIESKGTDLKKFSTYLAGWWHKEVRIHISNVLVLLIMIIF